MVDRNVDHIGRPETRAPETPSELDARVRALWQILDSIDPKLNVNNAKLQSSDPALLAEDITYTPFQLSEVAFDLERT